MSLIKTEFINAINMLNWRATDNGSAKGGAAQIAKLPNATGWPYINYVKNVVGQIGAAARCGKSFYLAYPVRVGILSVRVGRSGFHCLDEAVRAPQPVTPAR